MTSAAGGDVVIAVVGDGFGSILVYATAIYLGFAPEQVAIYGTSDDPFGTYRRYAHGLGQTVLRSESESHFLPADWPTFAQLDAWSRRSPRPLMRSIRRRYNPGVVEILAQGAVVQQRLGWNRRRIAARVGWVQREAGPPPHFLLYDEDANLLGRARHVMLALGHGGLNFPPRLEAARRDPDLADRVVQAYEAKSYAPGGRYAIVGSGIAAVNEWVNALEAGGRVLALQRNPMPDEQDLNTPRCLFEAMGVDLYQGMTFDERMEFLGRILKGTAPRRRAWNDVIQRARAEGRFYDLVGEISAVASGPEGLRLALTSPGGDDLGFVDVTGVVAATGFDKSPLALPLVRRLIEFYSLPLEHGRMVLQSNCGVPGLDQPDSRLCTMGLLANSVIPHGDTIAGLKYIARRFVSDCARANELPGRSFWSRAALQLSLARDAAAVLRHARRTEQLA